MRNQARHLPTTPSILPLSSETTEASKILDRAFRRYYIERMLPAARAAIGLGLAFVLAASAMDSILRPQAIAREIIPLRVATAVVPLLAVLAATYMLKKRVYLPYLFVTAALLVGVASIVIETPAVGREMTPMWGVVFLTFNAYLLLGLTLRQATTVGWPLLLAYAVAGIYFGVPSGSLAYALVLLVFLNGIGTYASFLLERDARELFDNKRELARLASTDGLTGLFNRHAFDQHLRRLWKQARREYEHIAILVADIDHFKLYNDCYGHKMGDDCIKAVAAVLAESVNRPLDVVARYGGEEFVIVLHDPTPSFLSSFAESLCEKVVALNIEHKASEQAAQCVSLSIGAALAESANAITEEQLIRQADDALYEAKNQGRNRAVVYRAEWGQQTTAHLAQALL
ncbi:MAG: diguanylate cyclase [Woeseiaceae bacterium]|nr:diguanylate cyclase [Woeseiaceae bacterium]